MGMFKVFELLLTSPVSVGIRMGVHSEHEKKGMLVVQRHVLGAKYIFAGWAGAL